VRTILAVDGGNSKTDAAVVREDGQVLGYRRGPQASPDHLGVEGSLDVLSSIAAELPVPVDVAVLLLAGIDFPDEEDAYREAAASRRLASRSVVGNDTFAVLRAGSERGYGVAVTCGAGINCVGVAPDGRQVRFPSLGPWSGDWGGGYDVGLAAVFAAARSQDGRGARTSLERLVPDHFGCRDSVELARRHLRDEVSDDGLYALAPLVLAEAEHDDVAGEIVDRLAAEVVTMARTALHRLGLEGAGVEVVLGGGLLQGGNGRLLHGVEAGLPETVVRVVPSPPVVGAALVGLDELGASAEAASRMRAELGDLVALSSDPVRR